VIVTKRLNLASATVLLALGLAPRVEAAPILFTDRDAFELAAHPGAPLSITDVSLVSSGTIRVVYGDLLPVLYDFAGFFTGCSPNPFVSTCTSITFGAGSLGAVFTSVQPFLSPVMAVGYELIGTFTLFGQVVHTDTPQFVGFVFDAPTTILPLPDYAYVPDPSGGTLPLQQRFSVQNIVVSTPEPATLMLFGVASALCLVGSRRKRPSVR